VFGDWPAPRVDNGRDFAGDTILTTVDDENTAAEVITSEGGQLWCNRNGIFVFSPRYSWLQESNSATSVATFTDDPSGSDETYRAFVTFEQEPYYASFRVNGDGVTAVSSTGSWAAAGGGEASASAPLLGERDECEELAFWYRRQFDRAEWGPKLFSTTPLSDSNRRDAVLDRDLLQRVTFEYTPLGGGTAYTGDHFIESVQHKITPGWWETAFGLSPAARFGFTDHTEWLRFGSGDSENELNTGTNVWV
jgi:hypothetical protein